MDLQDKQSSSFVVWFTGLSGSGKTTLAVMLNDHFKKNGERVELLDGDTLRTIFTNTGFSREERNSHIKRTAYIASLLERNGVIAITSLISPYVESREHARSLCRRFIEVYVSTPLAECEKRDVKGLYGKARSGELKNFTGIDDPYEPPLNPEITLNTAGNSLEESFAYLLSMLERYTHG